MMKRRFIYWCLMRECQAIGCARILLDQAKIGRMAILKPYRHKGVGRILLDEIIQTCQSHSLDQILLSAQTHAIPFYQKAGFKVVSEPYIDANIPHVDMRFTLKP